MEDLMAQPSITDVDVEELPLRVVPDWEEQLHGASQVCDLIDRHLDYEARGQGVRMPRDFSPQDLCPEQRIQMITDLYAVTQ
jgi:hypothetical protein